MIKSINEYIVIKTPGSEDDYLVDLEVLKNELVGLLSSEWRIGLVKRGISIVQNTYTGFDSEYENLDMRFNKLLTYQLAVNGKSILKIPKLGNLITRYQNQKNFNNELLKESMYHFIDSYRKTEYPEFDSSFSTVIKGLKKVFADLKLKVIEDDSWYIFIFPKSKNKLGIY